MSKLWDLGGRTKRKYHPDFISDVSEASLWFSGVQRTMEKLTISLKFSHRTIEYMENSPMNREVTRKTIQIIECSKNMVTEIFYQ